MSVDDLSTPLGVDLEPKKSRFKIKLGPIAFGVAATLSLAITGFIVMAKDPLGGEPLAVAAILKQIPQTAAVSAPSSQASAENKANAETPNSRVASASGRSSAAEIEEESGVRVVRQNGAAPSAVIIRVPERQSLQTRLAASPDRRLVEKSRHGPLPRIGPDGLKPLDIYARALSPAAKAKTAKIAIVIGGLGIGQTVTQEAIARLPGEISLGFAPYGNDLERQVQRARDEGHEVLLQLPMEPFDYPDNDPGPQTLLTSLSPTQNVDRLQWLMSRFTGYVGVMNFMGAKLTANDAAITPILREVSGRGLAYLDDGTSQRSLAVNLATSAGMVAARSDTLIDANQRASDIDASLTKLEALARERGIAVGVGSALPLTIERLARWAKTLEGKGIALVPVSSTLTAPRT